MDSPRDELFQIQQTQNQDHKSFLSYN